MDHATASTNANGETNLLTFTPAGDLKTLTDGKGQTTTWNYNAFGLVISKLDATGTTILTNGYDADLRLTDRWSAAKGDTAYGYDNAGNLTSITYPICPAISLAYDAMNRLTSMIDGVGTTLDYNAAGQLLSEDGPWSSDTVSFTYSNRLRFSLSLLQPNASPWNQTYTHDGARRLHTTTSPVGNFTYLYDTSAQMQVGNLVLPNGAFITNTYDSEARMLSTMLKNNGNTNLDAYTYVYNQASQRTSVTRTYGDPLYSIVRLNLSCSGCRWERSLTFHHAPSLVTYLAQ